MNLRDSLLGSYLWINRERLRDLLFDFSGRINREQYWLAWLAWLAAGVISLVIFLLISWLPYLAFGVAVIVGILGVNSGIAVGIKRLHDRGKSGWWLVFFYLSPAVLTRFAQVAAPNRLILELASLSIAIWMIVELGCLPGIAGPNRYGPDPLASAPEQPPLA